MMVPMETAGWADVEGTKRVAKLAPAVGTPAFMKMRMADDFEGRAETGMIQGRFMDKKGLGCLRTWVLPTIAGFGHPNSLHSLET